MYLGYSSYATKTLSLQCLVCQQVISTLIVVVDGLSFANSAEERNSSQHMVILICHNTVPCLKVVTAKVRVVFSCSFTRSYGDGTVILRGHQLSRKLRANF